MTIYYSVTKSSPTGDSIGVTRVRKDNAEYCVTRFAYQHLEAQGLLDSKFAHNLMAEIRTRFDDMPKPKSRGNCADPTLPDNRLILEFDCGFQRLVTVSVSKVDSSYSGIHSVYRGITIYKNCGKWRYSTFNLYADTLTGIRKLIRDMGVVK